MSETAWYYAKGTEQRGPVTWEILVNLGQSGSLLPTDQVWSEGMTSWQAAETVPGLFVAPIQPQAAGYANLYGQQGQYPMGQNQGGLNYFTPPQQVIFAGFWMRFCAIFLDGILLGVVGFAISSTINLAAHGTMIPTRVTLDAAYFFNQTLSLFINWLYFALMESSVNQATLGKMALGIKVTDLNGERIGFGRATGRYYAKILSYLIACIGFMMAGWTSKKQGLHDMLAGTLVIRK